MLIPLPTPVRRTARWLRSFLDRRLHPSRRTRAFIRLRAEPRPARYLVLCYGNICRSPYAARLLRNRLAARGLSGDVQEGGFYGPNRASPQAAMAAAAERGQVSLADHCSRLITGEDVRLANLVVVMEASHARRLQAAPFGLARHRALFLGDLDPAPINERSIPDPYGGASADFQQVYARIERCIDALVQAVETRADPSYKREDWPPSS